ncbi:MAG: nuclear transport factor 2 family protein [Steroidobacteraceae bacterium]
MERPEPILGWSAIAKYFEALAQHLEQTVEKRIEAIKVDVFGDAAVAFFEFHSVVRLRGGEGLYRPSGRVTMLFKRTQTGWRAIHYHESALAAQAADQIRRMKLLAEARERSDRPSHA